LLDVHDVFHVSQLKKYLRVPEEQLPIEDLDAKDLSYQKYHVKILETSEKVTQNKKIKKCKV
jgi:predicted GNAT family N-acyltransferase